MGLRPKTTALWKKNYDAIPRTMEFRFTKDKKRGKLTKNTKL